MKPMSAIFKLQELISDLAQVDRNHHLLNSEKAENDVEHSYSVAMLSWYICSVQNLPLDLEKIIKYSLVHDFVEVYAGDVNTFADKKARNNKVLKETKALLQLKRELHEFSNMIEILEAYEKRNDAESIFVWTIDKIQALVLANLDDWRPYKKLNITYDMFIKKHHEQLEQSSPYSKEIFTTLLTYFKTTFYDQPAL